MNTKLRQRKLMTCILFLLLVMSTSNLLAEDYLITFAGSGSATVVTTVKVENLTQCKSLTMDGSNTLRLILTPTGIESLGEDPEETISIYPNPMTEYSRIQFNLPESGKTVVTLLDISGREIVRTDNFLTVGSHTYKLEGIERGLYFVRINCGKFFAGSRLISSGTYTGDARIVYESMAYVPEKENYSKGMEAEQVMNYSTGDRLKFTGISGEYSTVVTDIPTAGKTITFDFIACKDADNNHYSTVKIGNQTWMAQNLKTTKFNNSTAIQLITDSLQWIALTGPGFCYYRNKENPNKDLYGGLYNWFAATSTNKLCPTEWHVPTDPEWTAFRTYLGSNVSRKLRETCSTLWTGTSIATNETGFTAVPGGWRHSANYNGKFDGLGEAADWWSSTEKDATYGYDYYIDSSPYYTGMSRENDSKNVGFSIRCIKDK